MSQGQRQANSLKTVRILYSISGSFFSQGPLGPQHKNLKRTEDSYLSSILLCHVSAENSLLLRVVQNLSWPSQSLFISQHSVQNFTQFLGEDCRVCTAHKFALLLSHLFLTGWNLLENHFFLTVTYLSCNHTQFKMRAEIFICHLNYAK